MFLKSIFTNSSGILVSRILGFIRDLLSASILGANIYSDIFFVAFKLPNLFRRIFGEGAFTQSFLPSFALAKYKGRFAILVFLRLFTIILLISFLVTLFSNQVTSIIALGFDSYTINLASPFVSLVFYYLDLIFVVTFLSALLHYKSHFSTTAFSTALLNIAMIIALLISKNMEKVEIVRFLCYGVLIGGFLQLFTHMFTIYYLNLHKVLIAGIKKKREISQSTKKFYNSFIPAIFGSSTSHISAFLDTFLASFLAFGNISYLYYANRVFQLPLALFAIAVSTALFPIIAKSIKRDDEIKAIYYLKRSFWILIFLLSFATILGSIFSYEITYLLFQRGEFSASDTQNTALILIMYMIGLLPFGLAKIFSLWLYSKHQQKLAAKISAISLGFNIVFSLILIKPFGASGLALASSISGFVLLFLNIKEFGVENIKKITDKKLSIIFCLSIILTIPICFFVKDLINRFLM